MSYFISLRNLFTPFLPFENMLAVDLYREIGIVPRGAPGCFTLLEIRFHLPHAIEVRLHEYYIDVVPLTPEISCSVGVFSSIRLSIQDKAMDVARSVLKGAQYCCEYMSEYML